MQHNTKIPTLIGIVLLVMGVAGGVLLVNRETVFQLGAAPESTPKDVRVTNLTDTSFTVSWITDKQSVGFVKWGETSNLGQTAQSEAGTKPTSAHLITVKGLTKNKRYYFAINSGGTDFKNNGVPWNTTTKSDSNTDVARVSGTIQLSTGTPATEALIYVDAPNMTQQSTMTSSSGNWVLSIPIASTQKDTLIDIYAQGGVNGIATAQVYLGSANPIPAISLGKTYDFRTLTQSTSGSVPDPSVTLPVGSTASGSTKSKFELSTKTAKPTSTVMVKSIGEGETVFSKKPEFFGEGPANTSITIKLNSTVTMTQTIKTAADGTWKWSPTKDLENGNHTLTVSWKDTKGVLQTITRSFVIQVQAAEPSFVSTPSAQTPTPKPTATPVATVAPTETPVATIKPTATPRPTVAPSTESALPNAGSPLATVSLLAFGLSLVLAGVFVSMRTTE